MNIDISGSPFEFEVVWLVLSVVKLLGKSKILRWFMAKF